MRKFNINVNGKAYEVEVEEVGAPAHHAPVARPAATPVAHVAPQAAPKAAPQAAAPAPKAAPVAVPAGGETISSPMPGTILDIKVAVGDSVQSGDTLCVLEAMKMENEIMAPHAGVIVSINVNKGASVNTGDVLIVLG